MKYIQYTLYSIICILFTSCGEDRTGEYYALIEDRMWIEETMRQNYLWSEHIPLIENENDYFTQPSTFFKNMLYKQALDGKGDSYSYMEEIVETQSSESRALTLNSTSTYGMEFELVKDPLKGTNHTLARILYVLPGSPAEAAGIKRGDWLTTIGKDYITNDNLKKLMYGGVQTFARDVVSVDEEGNYIWQPVDTVSVSPSIAMEISPFLVDSIYHINGQKIAYLVYNEFASGPGNDNIETVYDEKMIQIFKKFKSQSPDAFILDLRYNTGGYLSCTQILGSLLVPSEHLGKDFIRLDYNNQMNPSTISYPFLPKCADANLNMSKIYVLTSSYTASASEAVINGLKPYLGNENVIIIGDQTEGKNVAMRAFQDERFNFILWPVVAYVFNANGEGDYSSGFKPDYELIERNIISSWYPLGDEREYLLKNTLSFITTGTMPNLEIEGKEMEVSYSSIETRRTNNLTIQ